MKKNVSAVTTRSRSRDASDDYYKTSNLKNYDKCWRVLFFLLLSFLTLFGHTLTAQNTAKKPNILYILVDQWRAQATGYAGDKNVYAPNLDRLARQSVTSKMPYPARQSVRRTALRS